MNDESLAIEVQYLKGLVIGLQAALRGLIAAHPQPDHAMRQIELCTEDLIAAGLASDRTNAAELAGLENCLPCLLPTAAQLDRAQSA